MDDYSVTSLVESKNEWCARLVNIMTYAVIAGLKSIFEEAWKLCKENDEEDKYLMTFQTFLSRVPKWNNTIIETEKQRILQVSSCEYLEDLITCVHIIHLKALTCIRVGQEQKKVNIDIPSVDKFIHNIYISVARKVYTNVYLFERGIQPLEIQKHNRELELIIKESILNTIRDSMPVEDILKAYISETTEEEVVVKEEVIEKETEVDTLPTPDTATDPVPDTATDPVPDTATDPVPEPEEIKKKIDTEVICDTEQSPTIISFSDEDRAVDISGKENIIIAPKDEKRLDEIAKESALRRKIEEQDSDDDDQPLKIGQSIPVTELGIQELNLNKLKDTLNERPPILDIEQL